MPDICNYTNYRLFLKDYYAEVKSANKNFSYQLFSQRAGISSKGFLYNVIQGKRKVTKSYVFGLIKAMKLQKYEAQYFETLVAFNHANTLEERNYYFTALTAIKRNGRNPWKPQIVRQEQFEYYSEVYHSVIRSLIDLNKKDKDFEALAKQVYPSIKPNQAKKSIELLEKLKYISKQKDGSYKINDKSIATPNEVKSLAVLNYHEKSGNLALKALNSLPKTERNISGMTLGISKDTYNKMCDEITEFRTKLLQIAEEDEKADTVYQINFQFFPVSKKVNEG